EGGGNNDGNGGGKKDGSGLGKDLHDAVKNLAKNNNNNGNNNSKDSSENKDEKKKDDSDKGSSRSRTASSKDDSTEKAAAKKKKKKELTDLAKNSTDPGLDPMAGLESGGDFFSPKKSYGSKNTLQAIAKAFNPPGGF